MTAWVANYIGLPYKKYGRDREGLDCWGLCRLVYAEERGLVLDDLSERYLCDTRREFFKNVSTAFHSEVHRWHRVETPQEFDIAAFGHNGFIRHVGVVIDNRIMLHVENNTGACVQRHDTMRDLHGYYRKD